MALRNWASKAVVDGRIFLPQDRLQVPCRFPRVGFSWSLHIAQTISEAEAAETAQLSKGTLFIDPLTGVGSPWMLEGLRPSDFTSALTTQASLD